MPKKKQTLLTKPVIISAILIWFLLSLGFIFVLFLSSTSGIRDNHGDALVTVTAAPMENKKQFIQNEGLIPTQIPLDKFSGIYAIGMKVVVQGTGEDGLRLRSLAGREYETIYIAREGEVFIISDGPKVTSGYIWWQIRSVNSNDLSGWAVQDFLVLLND